MDKNLYFSHNKLSRNLFSIIDTNKYVSADNTETVSRNISVSSLWTPKVCCKFCLHKWNAPFRISTSSDRSVECYFRMEFSNYSPSPRASCDVAADSLYSEKYHFKKIPLEVAKGTISPNLATVRPYHSNKHFVAREGTKKRGKTQIAFQYFFLYFGVFLFSPFANSG